MSIRPGNTQGSIVGTEEQEGGKEHGILLKLEELACETKRTGRRFVSETNLQAFNIDSGSKLVGDEDREKGLASHHDRVSSVKGLLSEVAPENHEIIDTSGVPKYSQAQLHNGLSVMKRKKDKGSH